MKFDLLVEKQLKGLAYGKTLKDIAKKAKKKQKKKKESTIVGQLKGELKKGMKVEREHTKSSKIAKKIAMDHLIEDPKYYSKLKKIGL
jgi:hypothetical protein